MAPMRWLLVLHTRPTDDEAAYSYQLALYALDEPNVHPVVVGTVDELVDALMAHRTRLDSVHTETQI